MLKLNALGQTGIQVSCLGLGTVKFGRNQGVKYPKSFELPSDQQIVTLLQTAKKLGINTLDTAPAYGSSEQRLGKLLHNRRDWVIIGKACETFENGISNYNFTADFINRSVEHSLKNLNTDYLDVLLIHSNGDDVNIIQKYKVFETLEKLKSQKIIRAYGMSTKTIEGGLLTIAQADVAMVTYNAMALDEKPIIDLAFKKNKGILIKKALASGHLNKIADFIFQTPGVSSVIIGTLSPAHLQEHVLNAIQAQGENNAFNS